MDYTALISIGITIAGFVFLLIDRAIKEGAHKQSVEQIRKDVDHAHERCRIIESATQSGAVKMGELSTKIDFLTETIKEIKMMIERLQPRGQRA